MLQPGVLQCLLCCWTSLWVHAQQTAHKVYKALVLGVQSLPQAGALGPEELVAALQAWQLKTVLTCVQAWRLTRHNSLYPGKPMLFACRLPGQQQSRMQWAKWSSEGSA